MVADLDLDSRIGTIEKPEFQSKILTGSLYFEEQRPVFELWGDNAKTLVGKIAEEGRGLELSDLVLHKGELLTFDDRTGIVYKLEANDYRKLRSSSISTADFLLSLLKLTADERTQIYESLSVTPFPKYILLEGDGSDSNKGMKIEWACEKDGSLYVGSFGKEFTTQDGSTITGLHPFWVAVIDGQSIRRENWQDRYALLRKSLNATYPGYLIHEAVNWSPYHRKWFFLPRRVSSEPYDDVKDELRGSNKMIIADEKFEKYEVKEVKYPGNYPKRGFSSFKFVPGTSDKLIIAIRSAEDALLGTAETYLSFFDDDGTLIGQERLISKDFKFEGIEIW